MRQIQYAKWKKQECQNLHFPLFIRQGPSSNLFGYHIFNLDRRSRFGAGAQRVKISIENGSQLEEQSSYF